MKKIINTVKVIKILELVKSDLIKESEKGFFRGICEHIRTPYFTRRNPLEVDYIIKQMKMEAHLWVKFKLLFIDNFYWWKPNKKNVKVRIKFLDKLIIKIKNEMTNDIVD